jgi:hypothetical protein
MHLKIPQAWSIRVYVRFEACSDCALATVRVRYIDEGALRCDCPFFHPSDVKESHQSSLIDRSIERTTPRVSIQHTCRSTPIATLKHFLHRYAAAEHLAFRDRAVLQRSQTTHFLVGHRPCWRSLCARALSREAGFSIHRLINSSPDSPLLNDQNPQNWDHCPIANQDPDQ